VGWYGLDWVCSGQGPANAVTNLLVPYNDGKFVSSCTSAGLSERAQLHGIISFRF
jgi:hypothetical protein